jgi:hypothetical protein
METNRIVANSTGVREGRLSTYKKNKQTELSRTALVRTCEQNGNKQNCLKQHWCYRWKAEHIKKKEANRIA